MVAGQDPGDGPVGDERAEGRVDLALQLDVAPAHGDRDVPAVLRLDARDDLELRGELGRGVQGPADVGPEVGEVDLAVGQRLQRGELVAVEAAEVAPLAEPIIGDRAGLGAQAPRSLALELGQRPARGPSLRRTST